MTIAVQTRCVVVRGGTALAREALVAILEAAGVQVVEPELATVTVLLEPSEEDWSVVETGSKIVLVTAEVPDADQVLSAVIRGADAIIEADASADRLAAAIDVVAAGGTELSPTFVRRVADALRVQVQEEGPSLKLTQREEEILASIDRGETVKQTARTLGIAAKTVENLQGRLFRKLGVRNRAQAVALAHSLGLIPEP
jgi:two-component system, NarL family, nitrate/nitrite response regulator NarL